MAGPRTCTRAGLGVYPEFAISTLSGISVLGFPFARNPSPPAPSCHGDPSRFRQRLLPPKRCLRSLFRFVLAAVVQRPSNAISSARLRNIPALDVVLTLTLWNLSSASRPVMCRAPADRESSSRNAEIPHTSKSPERKDGPTENPSSNWLGCRFILDVESRSS